MNSVTGCLDGVMLRLREAEELGWRARRNANGQNGAISGLIPCGLAGSGRGLASRVMRLR